MATIDHKRLAAFESRLGTSLPAAFVAALTEREPIREGNVVIVTPDRVWDVRTTFTLDDGDRSEQLDFVYELVGDVMPAGTLPFAEDWGGNLYCLLLSGSRAGQVVWWGHERDDGDDSVEPVAPSVTAYYESLVPDMRD